ncbi:hypothetical protein POUND7_008522 [Theobroma cacao]
MPSKIQWWFEVVQTAVPSLKGESFRLLISGASMNDKIATDCLKHVKSGTLGGCMICGTMLMTAGKTFPAGPFQEGFQGAMNFIFQSPQKLNGGSKLFGQQFLP